MGQQGLPRAGPGEGGVLGPGLWSRLRPSSHDFGAEGWEGTQLQGDTEVGEGGKVRPAIG